MTVPEATMNEYDCFRSRKHEVWSTGKIFPMQPIAETESMQPSSNSQLRLRVTALDAGHHTAAGSTVYDVHGQRQATIRRF